MPPAPMVATISYTPMRVPGANAMTQGRDDTVSESPMAGNARRVRRPFYGWYVLLVAAAAMVGTLPGRTQGLGLITEPLLADLGIDRVSYAQLNLWATIAGSLGALGIGRLIDRAGSRVALTLVAVALGVVVCGMSGSTS